MKGHSSNSSGNYRGRPYGVMLLLAFGAAIFGVMVIHKLRERRIFNHLLKQKDRHLISLQLLLQKERDYNREVKRKNEEMKATIYSLGAQKTELDSRVSEMQSTISSLKDEQKTMESALEEKQKENKLHSVKEMASNIENQQVIALTEILKQKEAEIDDLKSHLENPVNVWSVSTDDPSRSMTRKDKSELTSTKDKTGELLESSGYRDGEDSMRGADGSGNESTNYRDEENSSSDEDRREKRVGFVDRREMTEEHTQKLENSQGHGVQGKKRGDSQDGDGFGIRERNKIANATHIINHRGEVSLRTSDVKVMDAKEHEVTEIGQSEKLDFQDGEGRKPGVKSEGGMKLDMPNNSQTGTGYRVRGNQGYASKTKGKKWSTLAKNKRFGNSKSSETTKDGMGSKTYKRFRDGELEKLDRHQNYNMSLKMRDESGQENGKLDAHDNHQRSESLEMRNDDQVDLEERAKGKDSTKEVIKAVTSNDVKLLKPQNWKDNENVIVQVRNTDINQQIEEQEVDVEYENSEKPRHSPDDVPKNRTVNGDTDGTASDARKQKTGVAKEEVSSGIKHQTERRDVDEVDSDSEEAKVADKYEEREEEDSEVTDNKEAETDMLSESRSESEEDKESYNEQTDEPEF